MNSSEVCRMRTKSREKGFRSSAEVRQTSLTGATLVSHWGELVKRVSLHKATKSLCKNFACIVKVCLFKNEVAR